MIRSALFTLLFGILPILSTSAQNSAGDFFWNPDSENSWEIFFDAVVSTSDSTQLQSEVMLTGPVESSKDSLNGRRLGAMNFRLEGLSLPDGVSALEGETRMTKNGDTLFVPLFAFPGLNQINLNLPEELVGQIYYPLALFSKDAGEKWTLQKRTIRVPFPDSLAPDNGGVVTYPDSVDFIVEAYGERMESVVRDGFTEEEQQFKLVITNYLKFDVKPFIGNSVTLIVPLLEEYELRTTWASQNVGITSIKADRYQIQPDWADFGESPIDSITVPAIDIEAGEIRVATTNERVSDNQYELPDIIQLSAYPNPFNPSTNISIELSETARITVAVYDLTGRKITTLAENKRASAGTMNVLFNAGELASQTLMYVVQGETQSGKKFRQTGLITLLK
jgi:hypothetical protein